MEVRSDIKYIKEMMTRFETKLDITCNKFIDSDKKLAILEEELTNHLQVHKDDLVKLGIFLTVLTIIVNFIMKFL